MNAPALRVGMSELVPEGCPSHYGHAACGPRCLSRPIQLVAEAIVLLEAQGVDTEAATRALGGGLAGSAVLERKASDMIARRFRPGFTCDLHHKELGIVMSVAREAGVVIPLGSVVTQLMAALVAPGSGRA